MAQVKLILREDVPSLGNAGDLVKVKPGYAWNYLVPQRKATPATEANVRELEHQKRVVAEKIAKDRVDQEIVKDRLEALELAVSARIGEEGRLFGSITAQKIADLFAEQGHEVDRRRIVLAEPIKDAGEHTVQVRLQGDLLASVKITVTAEA